jgi:ubiquinone/menaquinone biosynthesis C-methylase UbiE
MMAMRKKALLFSWICMLVLLAGMPLSEQVDDPLTLPGEIRLNKRQPPDTVLHTIGVKPGMMIGEVGAGRGRYTVHIASRIAPDGLIYANDIRSGSLEFLERRCREHGFSNVKTVLGSVSETHFPDALLDLVIMVNVVHHLEKPVELLKDVSHSLKPGGMIVVVDGSPGGFTGRLYKT